MKIIKIVDIIEHCIEMQNFYSHPDDISFIADATDRIVRSVHHIEERQETVRNYIGGDPYSWNVIPTTDFAELEERGDKEVFVEYEDGMVVSAPLLY